MSAVLLAILVRDSPLLVGLVAGTHLGAVSVLLVVMIFIADGSLFPRLGRALEHEVGAELLRDPDVIAVVSGISFEHRDVDHVVLSRAGCFAVEVKASFGRRGRLADVLDLRGKLAQARDGARQIERLLVSLDVPVPVTPVLLLTGSGSPDMVEAKRQGDVLVLRHHWQGPWSEESEGDNVLDDVTARAAADHLTAYRTRRTEYELARHR